MSKMMVLLKRTIFEALKECPYELRMHKLCLRQQLITIFTKANLEMKFPEKVRVPHKYFELIWGARALPVCLNFFKI